MDRLSRRNPTAGDIRRAFAARNPGLPESSVAVVANRRQWFPEVRLCLGENFRPRPCPVEDGGVADKVPVSIWPGQARKSVVEGKSVSVRVALGGRRGITKKQKIQTT